MSRLKLDEISTSELFAIRKILTVGATAFAGHEEGKGDKKSPPAGYPEEQSEYGDPACFRYPLNTKERCLAAWIYVNQEDSVSILGDTASSVIENIKNYAKEHYELDLQSGEAETTDWAKVFKDYYSSEIIGEHSVEPTVIVPDNSKEKAEVINMDNDEKDTKITTLESELQTKTAELDSKASQVESLTTEISDMKTELDDLRKFKLDTEEATERASKIQSIKSKLDEAGIEADLSTEAEYWLSMSDDVLVTTISKMSEMLTKVPAAATAEKDPKDPMKVPPVVSDPDDGKSAREVVAEGLREHRQANMRGK